MTFKSELETTRREVTTKLLQVCSREEVAEVSGIHLNSVRRFINGENIRWETATSIERAVNQINKAKETALFCPSCDE